MSDTVITREVSCMTSARLSLRLEPELKTWLEEEAKRKDRSAGYVVTQAIQQLKNSTEAKRELIQSAMLEAEKGIFVSEEAVTDWFLSLGTDNELPSPKPDVFLKS
jgi:predicted transcriptional regulator